MQFSRSLLASALVLALAACGEAPAPEAPAPAPAAVPAEAAPVDAPVHASFLRRALMRFGHRWQARLLAFDLKPLPWLHTLGAKAPLRISLLGLDLARTIVSDENAEWISPLHFA